MFKEAAQVASLVHNNNVARISAILIIVISLLVGIFISFLAAAAILLSYIAGFIVSWFLTKYQTKASLYLQRFASFYRVHVSVSKQFTLSCLVCQTDSCNRHKTSSSCPWKDLYINKELNDAVEHFYNTILENFVTSWYGNFTNDESFLNELRVSLRYGTASLVKRFFELDTSKLIAKKLVPCAIKHIDDYLCMQQIAKLKNVEMKDVMVVYLGKRLHAATTNRKNEIRYLRRLTACLLPHVLPQDCVNCRNYFIVMREIISGWVFLPLMDVLADPNVINYLVILISVYKSKGHPYAEGENVEFLHNFVNRNPKRSSFACDLKSILKTTQLLYAFMQFLKREGPVHILQFCLDIEDFNGKLLTPDLSKKQLESLHKEALNLYKMYFDLKSPECIGCSKHIESQFWNLLQEGVYNVAKLRTSEPLYQAYDHAFGILESEWLPEFFCSNEFYNYICGSKITPTYSKASNVVIKGKKYEQTSQGTVSKISSGLGRIKGVLRPNHPIEGAIYYPDLNMYPNGPSAFVEDILLSDCDNIHRDLSAWRVSIPSVDAHQIGGSKVMYMFNIHVQRIDTVTENEERHWVVQRKDQDFYTLKNKLIEFHGESEICNSPLPSRKYAVVLEARQNKYENFMRSLLQKPSLRGSDLLHTFLTSDQDFTMVVSTTVPVVEDLGNIYQSVAFKLRKEKGQHLDSFMNTFLASTMKSKQSKFEWAEIGDEVDMTFNASTAFPTTYNNPVFNDNFGIPYVKSEEGSSTSFNPDGITESLFYLLKHTFKVRHGILKLFAAICSIGPQAVESVCRIYIDKKLKSLLNQSNLAYLITLLEGVVFQTSSSHTKEELDERRERAFQELQNLVPHSLQTVLGTEFTNGLASLLELLQNPLYNKQLAYNLLDIVAAEMYPQLNEKENVLNSYKKK